MTLKINIGASSGGLNLADPLDNMQPQYAIQMDNIIPDPNGDKVRSGHVKVATGIYDKILPVPFAGNEKIVVAKEDTMYIYDPTNWSTAPTTKGSFTSDEWTSCPFTDGSGTQHVFFANGVDTPQDYTTANGMSNTGFTTTG